MDNDFVGFGAVNEALQYLEKKGYEKNHSLSPAMPV